MNTLSNIPPPEYLKSLKRDDNGTLHLGSDGVLRSIIVRDNTVIDAMALNPAQIKEMVECFNQNIHITGAERTELPPDADGTKVPDDQLFNPPEGILPKLLTEEERQERKKWIKTENERVSGILDGLKAQDAPQQN